MIQKVQSYLPAFKGSLIDNIGNLNSPEPQPVKDVPATTVAVSDTVEKSIPQEVAAQSVDKSKKPKKGIIQSSKDVIRTVKKFFVSIGDYGKGTAKGILEGGFFGGLTFGALKLINAVKKFRFDRQLKNAAKKGAEVLAAATKNEAVREAVQTTAKAAGKAVKEGAEAVAKKVHYLPAKTLGIIVGVAILLGNLWKASLNANDKKADVDHRYTQTPIVDGK
jgi:hypothetical protein